MTFDEVMTFTRTVSSHTAFEDVECEAYYNLLMSLPARSTVLEIGLQYGRSSSIALQVAKAHDLRYFGIDPFTDPPEAEIEWIQMAAKIDVPYVLLRMTSEEAYKRFVGVCPYLILVDGDHTREGVLTDLRCWTENVLGEGYMCFHDYGRDSLPDVYPTVNKYFSHLSSYCKEVGVAGTLGIWQFGDKL